MLVFSVYIPFLISRVRPVHSIFEKKSILENPSQIFTNLFFHAYMAYMPSFLAWLFVRHSKITKLFQVSQLSSDFFRVSSIFPASFPGSLSHLLLFASLSWSLRLFFFFLSSLFLSSFTPSHLLFLISPSLSLLSHIFFFIFSCSSSFVLYCVLFFSFSFSFS